MDVARLTRVDSTTWRIEPHGAMRVPAIIYADEGLIRDIDDKVYEQAANVAALPGIVGASYAMPDAHWGYGFPIGGVAAFDPEAGGIVSAGGVGFDISCGVRTMLTGLAVADILPAQKWLADSLFRQIPAGLGSKGAITLDAVEMDAMLLGGARWAIEHGWGEVRDLERIEEGGTMAGARPACISERAKERQRREMGTLGSGNHYLEVQAIAEIYDAEVARVFGLAQDEVVVTIHCGSRGLGHQIGTEFLKEMVVTAAEAGIELPDRELACAPINSEVGQRYLGAMRGGINCALANREILGHYARRVFHHFFPACDLQLLYDVSTTPVRSSCTPLTASSGSCLSIARVRRGLSDLGIRACPKPCVRWDSPCSSAAAWGRAPTFLSVRQQVSRRRFPQHATAPAAHCPGTPRSSDGAGAPSSTSWPRRVLSSAVRLRAVSRRKRPVLTRTWGRW